MKVLQINTVYGYGSTGKIVKNLHNFYLNSNIDSYVIYARCGTVLNNTIQTNDLNTFKFDSKIEKYIHILGSLLFNKHGLFSNNNTRNIISKIDEINPDIIHLHNIHGFYLNYKILFKYFKNKKYKIVWTLHDCWSFTGFCSYFDYNNCSNFKNDCKYCKFKNVYPYRLFGSSFSNLKLKDELFNGLDINFVACSMWLKNNVEQSILKNNKITVINNTIDTSIFKPTIDINFKKDLKIEDKIVLLTVASPFTIQKGFNEVIKFSKMLDDRYRIIMIGVNSKQIKMLPSNIIGISRTDNQRELIRYYSNCDCLINLTLEDNYPTVLLEAFACNLNVISYDTGGCKEICKMYNGHVVKKYDLNSLLEKLQTISFNYKIHNNVICKDMGKQYLKLYLDIKDDKI